MKSMRVILDFRPFEVEIKLSGPTKNAHLRQALLQMVRAIEREQVSFHAFKVVPERTYTYANFADPVWRAKHSHTIENTGQAGYELRQKRLKLGLSGRAFARLLDVHSTYLSHVEHGRRPVSESLRVKAESIFRTRIHKIEHRGRGEGGSSSHLPLGTVVHEGQTFFEDLQHSCQSIDELKQFFKNVED